MSELPHLTILEFSRSVQDVISIAKERGFKVLEDKHNGARHASLFLQGVVSLEWSIDDYAERVYVNLPAQDDKGSDVTFSALSSSGEGTSYTDSHVQVGPAGERVEMPDFALQTMGSAIITEAMLRVENIPVVAG